ncbi:MAG: thioredoxin family protein [Candidatus Neomarinimicrobiota bacterium]
MKKRSKLLALLVVAILAFTLLMSACSGKKADAGPKKASSVTMNEKLPKMVDFWSPTCPPCRQMMPILAELEEEYAHAFKLVKVDTSKPENRDLAMQNQIQYIPTQIFYDENGEQLFRHVGFYSKEDILNKWKELGYDFQSK